MDVIAMQSAVARSLVGRLRGDNVLRPASPLIVPLAAMSSPPTVTLTKASGVSAVSSVAAGGSGYGVNDVVTLTGGTFAVAAKLRVTAVSSGAVTAAAVERGGVYSVAPSNPVAQGSTTGSGTGATFNVTTGGGSASSVATPTSYGPTSAVFRFTGVGPMANIGGSGYYGQASYQGTAAYWEWTTDADSFDIKLVASNTSGMLFIDGQRVDSTGVTTDSSGGVYVYTVANPTAVPRNYRLVLVNSAFGGVQVPTTATVWLPTQAERPLAYGLGDSYMFGTGATNGAMSGFNQMCGILGLQPIADGIGSTGWTSTSTNLPSARISARLSTLTRTPDFVFLDLGYNDAGGNMTTLSSNFTNAVSTVRTYAPKARVIVFGPATPLGTTANLTTVKTTLSGLCTTLGPSFVDVDNWVSSANKSLYTGGDNTHPTQAGYDYLAGRRAQAVGALLAAV